MKINLWKGLIILLLVLSFAKCKKDSTSNTITYTLTTDSLTMGSSYANDVYYNLESGSKTTVSRTNWDIAFNTDIYSATIITNGGAGVKLYTYKGDTAAWNNMDITSISTVMYNSDTTWSLGAFQRHTTTGLDYGWGVYNTSSHDIVGDSLFIVQLQDSSYRKLWIKRKASLRNTYIFQYANLDGSGLKVDSVNCASYTNKNFIYYSIANSSLVDREPISSSWDFVATKYISNVAYGNTTIPYVVTGILTNNMTYIINPSTNTTADSGVFAAKLSNVNVSTTDYSTAKFSNNISTIGWDWKSFNSQTYTYTVTDSLVYFVKNRNSKVYKIVFTGFAGSGTGIIKFEKTLLN
jgi:hypothetical protein